MKEPPRFLSVGDRQALTPVHVVWEITLACDLKCQHCGSRAGKRRPRELSTAECMDLVRQMARLGTRAVTLIGGEAYLRRDWVEIVREITDQGMYCTMQTGGLHLTEDRVRQASDAGLQGVGVSVDGLRAVHDRVRGVKGSFDAALKALRLISNRGMSASATTQITSLVIPQLRPLMNRLIAVGVTNWQVQLTVAMGRAADHPELLLQPYELSVLMPLLAELFEEGVERGLLLQPGNNIGYFGPYESLWRGNGDERIYWASCNAGQNTMGIEADGTIKGCPSLPTTQYAGGNIRDLSLEDIWRQTPELNFTRSSREDTLWGFCRTCYYAEVCQAGCTWTSHSLLGRPGNNPYCHHRVLELARQGMRERIEPAERAPGSPFDHGRFELVRETLDGSRRAPEEPTAYERNAALLPLVQITSARAPAPPRGVSTPSRRSRPIPRMQRLILCRGCNRHVKAATPVCPHCGGDIKALAVTYGKRLLAARQTFRRLLRALGDTAEIDPPGAR